MPLILHPHVIDVLNVADELLDGHDQWHLFEQVLGQMDETHIWQQERYQHFRQGQKRTSTLDELRTRVEASFAARTEALADLRTQIEQRDPEGLSGATTRLQKSSQAIALISEELEAEDSRHRLAAMPLLHDFLQAGFNVYGGYESYPVLRSRLAPVVDWITALEADWAGECELFESLAERQAEFEAALQLCKNGVGAILTFEESGVESDLLAGLAYFQEGAQQLAAFVWQARQDSADMASYSNFREVERFAVRLSKLGLEDEATEQARARVIELFERQAQQLQGMADIPVHSEVYGEALAEVEATLEKEREALEANDVEALGEASMAFQSGLEGLAQLLEESSHDLEEAPALQELRRAVLGVYYNQVPRRFLRDLLFHITPGFEKALELENEPDARAALEACLSAMGCAEVGLEEASPEALAESYRLLNQGGSALIEVQRRRVAQVAEQEESRRVTCAQCGVRQEPAAVCAECGAKIIKAHTGVETSSLQVSEGAERIEQPQSLEELFDLVARIREGVAEPDEILAVVDPVRARAKSILQQATAGGASEQFLFSVQQFSHGLEQLAGQARSRDLEALEESNARLHVAAAELLAYK